MKNDPSSVFIIGELSANHNGSLDHALRIVDAIAKAGADAVKMQTYRPEGITLNSDRPEFLIEGGLWDGARLYDLYGEGMLPWEWHEPLYERAKAHGIIPFSAPFEWAAVDFLEELGTELYKIASPEIVDIPLIARVARTSKPMIISTGMASLDEIKLAVETARQNGAGEITILHCVSSYPTPIENAGLGNIGLLKDLFPDCKIGLSDHTLGTETALASVACGARAIEKHITLRRADGGLDSAFSLEPEELADLVAKTRQLEKALRPKNFGVSEKEKGSVRFRRSLYATEPIAKGEVFTEQNVKSVRPANGLPPKYFDKLTSGLTAIVDIEKNTPLSFENTGINDGD